MNKRELALLEKAFEAEVLSALSDDRPRVMQTRSKLAGKLVAEGLLSEHTEHVASSIGSIEVKGYVLTQLGHFAYCMTCDAEDDASPSHPATQTERPNESNGSSHG